MTETGAEVQRAFTKALKASEKIGKLQARLRAGKAAYKDAEAYAELVAQAYAGAYKEVVGTAAVIGGDKYFATAQEVFPQGLYSIFTNTAEYVEQVQKIQNETAGIGLKALVPDFAYIHSQYLEKLNSAVTDDGLDAVIPAESEIFAKRTVFTTAQVNMEAQDRAGLTVLVTRTYGGRGVHDGKDPCQWCISRCGSNMTFSEAKAKEAFNVHPGCKCVITYTSTRGETTARVGGGRWQKINPRR